MRFKFLRDLFFPRKPRTIHKKPRQRSALGQFVESLEERTVPTAMVFAVQTDFFGTVATSSQPRSLRGMALSGDEAHVYGGFISGTSSAAIREVSSGTNSMIIGNDGGSPVNSFGANPPYTTGLEAKTTTLNQAKGLATDDRGYVYATLNNRTNSATQGWAIYPSNLASSWTYVTSPTVGSQLAGLSVQKLDPDGAGPEGFHYYAYLSHNGGAAQIERWDVTNPASAFLDTAWGSSGKINLKSEPAFGTNAFANGLEVDTDGTLYVAGGILGTGRGDSVFKIPADGNLSLASRVNVNGAMDLALYQGNVYVTQYLAASSTIAVLQKSDLTLADTITSSIIGTYPTGADSGFSGIDINATGKLYVVEQLYNQLSSYTPPGGVAMTNTILFDRIITTQLAFPPASDVYVDDNWVGLANGTDPDGVGPRAAIGFDAFATIQGGVDGVLANGTVHVLAGTYPENVTNAKTATLEFASGVTVNPGAGNAFTISANSTTITGPVNTTGRPVVALTGGTLVVDGNVTGPVTIDIGGFLTGNGTVNGNTVVNGTHAPGHSPSIQNTGNYTQAGTLSIEIINPVSPPAAGTDYDQVNVTGNVTITGSLSVTLTGSLPIANGTVFTIINNDDVDAVSGTFTSRPNGSTFLVSGQNFQILYNGGDGNDVVLVAVPFATPLNTVYVDDNWVGLLNGADPDGAGPRIAIGYDSFATIQSAVTAVASAGSVYVAPGSYSENITVGKQVSLYGARAGVDARGRVVGAPNPAVESVITPAVAGTASINIAVNAPNITVDGFTFTGGTSLGVIQTTVGPNNNLQILNNHFAGYSGAALFINRSGSDVTIDKNVMDGGNIAGTGQAIFLDGPNVHHGIYITNNDIRNNAGRYGIFVDGNHNVGESATRAPSISNNTFTNNNQGMNLGSRSFGTLGAPVTGPYGGYIVGNTFTSNTFDGIQGGPQHTLISQNAFTNTGRSGIALTSFGNLGADRGGQNNLITQNSFSNSTQEDMFFSATQVAGSIATNTVFNNSFGSTRAVTYGGTEIINTSGNWWGSNVVATIQSFIGGAGASNVDFTPFLNSAADTSGNAGFQGNLSYLNVTTAGAQAGATGRVQEAVDDAVAPGIVHILAGTYIGTVNLNKTLTLRGATGIASDVVIDPPGPGINVTANNTVISNLTVTAFDDGIVATNVVGLTVNNVRVTANADDGIVLANVGGTVALTNVLVDLNGGDGLDATAQSGAVLTMANVSFANNTGSGLKADGFGVINLTDLSVVGNGNGGSINPTLTPSTTINYLATTGSSPYNVTASDTSLQFTRDPLGANIVSQAIAMNSLGGLSLTGGTGNDRFLVTPSAAFAINVNGNLPNPSASPGDVLDLVLTGTTGGTLTRTLLVDGYTGNYSFTNRANVSFSRIELLVDLVNSPSITGTVAGQAITDKQTVKPFSGVTITTDGNDPVTVSITLSSTANGAFSAASLLSSGFSDMGGGVYQRTGSPADITTGIRLLVFVPTENQVTPPGTVTTTFTIVANDGATPPTTDNTTTVIVTSANDPTVITGTVSNQATDDKTPILPFSNVTFTDVDPNQLLTIQITLTSPINGKFSDASLAASGFGLQTNYVYFVYLSQPPQYFYPYIFQGTAAQATAAIRQLEFVPTQNQVAPAATVFTRFNVYASDGFTTTLDQVTSVNTVSVNDAPTISGTVAGQTTSETVAIKPFTNVVVADVDNPSQTLTVTVTLSNAANGTLSGGGFSNLGGGVYRFIGSPFNASNALRNLSFKPTLNQATPGNSITTTFTIGVSDGIAPIVTNNTTTVISSVVNIAPTIAGARASQAVTDKATVKPFSAVTIADVSSGPQTQTVQVTLSDASNGTLAGGSFTPLGGGVYQFVGTAAQATTAIRALTFTPTANQATPNTKVLTGFTITVNDGFDTTTNAITTVLANSVNDAPTITGVAANQAVTDKTTVTPFSAVTIGDVDNPAQNLTVTISLSSSVNGSFSTASLSASGFGGQSATYTFSGTAAEATTAIRQLVFVPTENLIAPGQSTATRFTLSVFDGIVKTTNTTTTVNSLSINDGPTISGLQPTYNFGKNPVTNPFAGVLFGDVDKSQNLTLVITIGNLANGTFSATSLRNAGFVSLGGGQFRYIGLANNMNTALTRLQYVPTPAAATPGNSTSTTVTFLLTDPLSATSSTTVIATY